MFGPSVRGFCLSYFVLELTVRSLGGSEPAVPRVTPPRIRISPETTRVTGPLDAEGYVDFLAACNAQAGAGITLENNAYLLLLQAVGPAEGYVDTMHAVCDALGIPRLPVEGEYLVPHHPRQETVPAVEPGQTDPVVKQFEQAVSRPWVADEFPAVVELLARNEKPLALVAAAVLRPRYYRPMVRQPQATLLFEQLLPDIQCFREVAQMLRARAMWHLGEGRLAEAQTDLLTMHRLASVVGQGQFFIERLVGIAIEALACAGDQQLLVDPQFTPQQARAYRTALRALPPPPRVLDCINHSERLGALDVIQALARGRSFHAVREIFMDSSDSIWLTNEGRIPTIDWSQVAQALLVLSVDWNVVMAEVNRVYDDFLATYTEADSYPTRLAQLRALEEHLKQRREAATSTTGLLTAVLGSNRLRGQSVSDFLASLMLPSLQNFLFVQENGAMMRELVIVGTALREYRGLHGQYPDNLECLVPEFLPEPLLDRFTSEPLRYQTTGQTFLLYSVGRNGKDDGGHMDPKREADDRRISDPPFEY